MHANVVVVGGGPAGLSAALNLGRARASVVLVDAARPRNAATLRSHGFLTRDGVPPLELRKLARVELAAYPNVRVLDRSAVIAVAAAPSGDGSFVVSLHARARDAPQEVVTGRVLIATGVREMLPAIPGLTGFYGMTLFSCALCDGWELRDRPLALIGETSDLPRWARLITRWTDRLTVFTNGAGSIAPRQLADLADRGITVDSRPIAALEGDRGAIDHVRLVDDAVVPVRGGFVRPVWRSALDATANLGLRCDSDGFLLADLDGRTSVAGLYGAGDAVAPGPQQLIVAAGQGARAAAAIIDDLIA
ncbi:NAD(P)/FAD-dependent oxidoreductase [Microbacterium sp.]|uniref:NAD(P)/FAD-dependent oxidoreductase n=1 Tax=Microbacterium sp. TaxID=51671 RepID=UPI003C735A0F